jgi:hypothetical protein
LQSIVDEHPPLEVRGIAGRKPQRAEIKVALLVDVVVAFGAVLFGERVGVGRRGGMEGQGAKQRDDPLGPGS